MRTIEEYKKIAERWTLVAVFSAGAVTGLTFVKILLIIYVANGWPIR
jgi:hypothetical protein